MTEIDPIKAARLHRNLRSKCIAKQPYHYHIPHNVMQAESLDPSLSHRLAYGNRVDWYGTAAMCGWFDTDVGVEEGLHHLLLPTELSQTAQGKRKTGMNLYE